MIGESCSTSAGRVTRQVSSLLVRESLGKSLGKSMESLPPTSSYPVTKLWAKLKRNEHDEGKGPCLKVTTRFKQRGLNDAYACLLHSGGQLLDHSSVQNFIGMKCLYGRHLNHNADVTADMLCAESRPLRACVPRGVGSHCH
jgi:hypothetical protein